MTTTTQQPDFLAPNELLAAFERGGVDPRVLGSDRYEVFRNLISGLPAAWQIDRQSLLDRLLARENSAGVPIGHGIAIPHPRYPLIVPSFPSTLRTCYLAEPLRYSEASRFSQEGAAVDIILLLVCPVETEHDQLLAQLRTLLETSVLRENLRLRVPPSQLLSAHRAASLSAAHPMQGNPT